MLLGERLRIVCRFDGQVTCHFEARRVTQHQVCK